MTQAEYVRWLQPDLLEWSAFSPAHKVELTSHAVQTRHGWWIFDPIPLKDPGRWLRDSVPVAGILLTNENHERDSAMWAARFRASIRAADTAILSLPDVDRWSASTRTLEDWELIPLTGGAGGETAFHLPSHSLLVIGDAVVNLPGRSLEILPDRYCQDPVQLRLSLRNLPNASQAVLAHGTPLLENAGERIRQLVS